MKVITTLIFVQGFTFISALPINVKQKESSTLQTEAEGFVSEQFANWANRTNCQGFVDSFSDPFEYCDATESCITLKVDLMDECLKVSGMAGNVLNLDVKPSWSPGPNYTNIAITGTQGLNEGKKQVGCFDFAVVEHLEQKPDGTLTSHLWQGYYTMSLGRCAITKASCGFLCRLQRKIFRRPISERKKEL